MVEAEECRMRVKQLRLVRFQGFLWQWWWWFNNSCQCHVYAHAGCVAFPLGFGETGVDPRGSFWCMRSTSAYMLLMPVFLLPRLVKKAQLLHTASV